MKKIYVLLVVVPFLSGCDVNSEPVKEKVTVTYKVLEEVVNTKKVIKGEKLGTVYIYESNNHQSFVSEWFNNDTAVDENTIINSDVTLTGSPKSSLKLFNTPDNEYVYVNGTNHVHSDGKVVVLSQYYEKYVNIGVGAFNNNNEMKELYLPSTIHQIFSNNFVDCQNLTHIYFAGSEEQWTSIPNESTIPDYVSLVFNTEFNTVSS